MQFYVRVLTLTTMAMLLNAAPAVAWGPDRWIKRQQHVVRVKPRSVFVEPVGYAYPEIKYRTVTSSYRPLSDPTPSAAFRLPPTSTTPRR